MFRRLELALQPLPAQRVLGVCQFPTFQDAMEATPAIVGLGPSADARSLGTHDPLPCKETLI